MQYPDPENSHRNRPEGLVAGRALVVAGGEAAELLAAVEQALHPVAQPVSGAVERPAPPLGAEAGQRVANAPPATVAAPPP